MEPFGNAGIDKCGLWSQTHAVFTGNGRPVPSNILLTGSGEMTGQWAGGCWPVWCYTNWCILHTERDFYSMPASTWGSGYREWQSTSDRGWVLTVASVLSPAFSQFASPTGLAPCLKSTRNPVTGELPEPHTHCKLHLTQGVRQSP